MGSELERQRIMKTRPSNVVRFEYLMYLQFGICEIVFASQWRTWSQSVAHKAGFVIFGAAFLFALLLAFVVLVIWLAARRHKNWARWFLLVTGILGLPGYVKNLGQMLLFSPVAG